LETIWLSKTQSFTAIIFKNDINPTIKEKEVQNKVKESQIDDKIKRNKKKTEQRKLLQEAFEKNSKLDTKTANELVETLALTKKQVQNWFSKERKRQQGMDKENVPPCKKIALTV